MGNRIAQEACKSSCGLVIKNLTYRLFLDWILRAGSACERLFCTVVYHWPFVSRFAYLECSVVAFAGDASLGFVLKKDYSLNSSPHQFCVFLVQIFRRSSAWPKILSQYCWLVSFQGLFLFPVPSSEKSEIKKFSEEICSVFQNEAENAW